MFYLWRDKRPEYTSIVVYITDYKENENGQMFIDGKGEGKHFIDGQGYIDVELLYQHEIKNEVLKFAQNIKQ